MYKVIKQAGKIMVYFNTILVLIIAFQIVKLYIEHKEMGQTRNSKRVSPMNLRTSTSPMKQ